MAILLKVLNEFTSALTAPILYHLSQNGLLFLIAQTFIEFVDLYAGIIIYIILLIVFTTLLNFLLKQFKRVYTLKTTLKS